jgi:hypothetical protein
MAYKISFILKDIHILIIDEETIDVLTSRIHEKCLEDWKWKGPHILAFELSNIMQTDIIWIHLKLL